MAKDHILGVEWKILDRFKEMSNDEILAEREYYKKLIREECSRLGERVNRLKAGEKRIARGFNKSGKTISNPDVCREGLSYLYEEFGRDNW